uniref:Uncharacterized protein n=1 Tax=Arundo donax TaxID=35708 RepID=A0A0A9ASF6_ARUDO
MDTGMRFFLSPIGHMNNFLFLLDVYSCEITLSRFV